MVSPLPSPTLLLPHLPPAPSHASERASRSAPGCPFLGLCPPLGWRPREGTAGLTQAASLAFSTGVHTPAASGSGISTGRVLLEGEAHTTIGCWVHILPVLGCFASRLMDPLCLGGAQLHCFSCPLSLECFLFTGCPFEAPRSRVLCLFTLSVGALEHELTVS